MGELARQEQQITEQNVELAYVDQGYTGEEPAKDAYQELVNTHTREDETYYVLSGELNVKVGDQSFLLRPGDTLLAPRNIPHQLRNTGRAENRYLIVFSPAGFENFLEATAVTAPEGAPAPTEPPGVAVQNVMELAASYGIYFG